MLLVTGGALGRAGTPVHRTLGQASGAPGSGGSQGLVNLTLNATDAPAFSPAYLTAAAGASVHLKVVNTGRYDHTFTLATNGSAVLNPHWTPEQLWAYFAMNGTIVNATLPAGRVTWVNFTLVTASPGKSYEFVSVVPYQFQAGMAGFLNVTGGPTGPGVTASVGAVDALAFVPANVGVAPTTFPAAIDVKVSNLGSLGHTWTLDPTAGHNLTPSGWGAYLSTHPPLANVTLTAPGQVVWANFTVNAPGVYEFICEAPGHFLRGMFGYLFVGIPIPAGIAGPSNETVQPIILEGTAALTGVGLVLVAVSALVGRIPRGGGPAH